MTMTYLYLIMRKKKKVIVRIDEYSYGERELTQLIRRKMITKETRNKKKYTRKEKHKGTDDNSEPFLFYPSYNTLVSLLNNVSTPAFSSIGLRLLMSTCFPLNLIKTLSGLEKSNTSNILSSG